MKFIVRKRINVRNAEIYILNAIQIYYPVRFNQARQKCLVTHLFGHQRTLRLHAMSTAGQLGSCRKFH